MDVLKAMTSGLAGAAAVNLINETARQFVPEAPRLDLEGQEFVAQRLRALDVAPPTGRALYGSAMAFDMAANTLYYSAVAASDPQHAPLTGAALGLLAGVGNVIISPALGLSPRTMRRTPAMTAMTIAWYTAGGLAAGAMYRLLSRK
jgi:hypothetical protein